MAEESRAESRVPACQPYFDAFLRMLPEKWRVITGSITIHVDRGVIMKIVPCPTLRPGRRREDLPLPPESD
jgi:hypothetical protein